MTRTESVDVSVTWCTFTGGNKAYSYSLRVNGKYVPTVGQFRTIREALDAAATECARYDV